MADAKVAPRFDVQSNEKISGFVGMGEMLKSSVKTRPSQFMDVIEDMRGIPTFEIDQHGAVVKEASSNINPYQEPEQKRPVNTREDCVAGCGGKATVQPLNSAMTDWECSQCGKKYTMK